MLKNSGTQYGVVSKVVHWVVALSVVGLFAVGYWMVELSYYSPWYRTAPYWHKSIGVLLALLMLGRLLWRYYSPPPKALASHGLWTRRAAKVMQLGLYLTILILVGSGYLISTADGRPIAVFDWFSVPSLGMLFPRQTDIAGVVHEFAAYSVLVLAGGHAGAALKHHVIDKDNTLKRMLGE